MIEIRNGFVYNLYSDNEHEAIKEQLIAEKENLINDTVCKSCNEASRQTKTKSKRVRTSSRLDGYTRGKTC